MRTKESRTKFCLGCSAEYPESEEICPRDGIALISLTNPKIESVIKERYRVKHFVDHTTFVAESVNDPEQRFCLRIFDFPIQNQEDAADVEKQLRLLKTLSHKHILQTIDYGTIDNGNVFLASEYHDYETLSERQHKGDFTLDHALKIFIQVADALSYAHRKGILHRGISTNAILINASGDAFLTGFFFRNHNSVRHSGRTCVALDDVIVGQSGGTVEYFSPEQCMGKPIGAESDVYSLGVVMLEIFTGRNPFRSSNSMETASKHMQMVVPRFAAVDAGTPDDLELILQKCLNKRPDERYLSMDELKSALTSVRNEALDSITLPMPMRSFIDPVVEQSAKSAPAKEQLTMAQFKRKIHLAWIKFFHA